MFNSAGFKSPFGRMFILAGLILILLTSCSGNDHQKLHIGDVAPPFTALDLQGRKIILNAYTGKPVVLRFFYPNCRYCRADTAVFNQYYREFKDQGLLIVYLDTAAKGEDLQKFVDDLKIKFPVISDARKEVADKYRVNLVPQTIVLSPQHRIIAAILGGVSREQLDSLLGKFLVKKPITRN
ncbi:TlpA family protein disulfide reductase [Desulfobacterota bacterium M19]